MTIKEEELDRYIIVGVFTNYDSINKILMNILLIWIFFNHINIMFTSTSNQTPSLYVVILYLFEVDDNKAGFVNSGLLTVNGPALRFPTGLKK